MYDQNEMKLLYEAFFAIAESYTSMIYLDTEDDVIYPIRLDEYSKRYEEALRNKPSAAEIFKQYVRETVFVEDAVEVMKFSDKEYVLERLKSENPILHIYRALHHDRIIHYRLKIVPIEDGKKIVFGFENIDNQYRKQLEIKAENEMHISIRDALTREYMSVWYLDGKSRKVRLIRNNGSNEENGDAVRIGSTMVDYHFSMQKYFERFVNPEDFDRLMEETSYDTLTEKVGDNLYTVNYIRNNPDGSRSHFQACYAKIADQTGISDFVVGFRNIDSAVI